MPLAGMLILLASLNSIPAGAAGEWGLDARVDALERRFEAELKQMKGELEQMGDRLDSCESESELGQQEPVSVDPAGLIPEEDQTQTPAAGREEKAAQLSEKKDEEVPQAQLQGQVEALQGELRRFVNTTKADAADMRSRLDQCASQSRRRNQQQTPCGQDAAQRMLTVCCGPGTGIGHRRGMQGVSGCDSLPSSCSLECSDQFVSFFEDCQGEPVMQQLPAAVMADWTGGGCRA